MAPVAASRMDGELVVAARSGDTEAFEQLYRRYFDPLFDFAARTTKSKDAAADIVQDAFIKAHARLDQLRNPDAFRPWMYAIVRREALGLFRSQKREVTMSTLDDSEASAPNALQLVPSADPEGDPVTAAELADSAALVWEAAASLDADTYTVLDLYVRQGLSSAEIADVLGISKGSAYTRVNRTKERAAGAIATYLLVRKGSSQCGVLSGIVDRFEPPPVSKQLKRAVDAHVRDCDDCERRRRAMVAPIQVFAALAAVPPPTGLATDLWSPVSTARSHGVRRGRIARIVLGVLLVAVMGLVLGFGVRAISSRSADTPSPTAVTSAGGGTDAVAGAGGSSGTTVPGPPSDSVEPTDGEIDPANPPSTDDAGALPDPVPPQSSPSTNAAPPTIAPDVSPPVISNAFVSPDVIFELDEDFLSCPPGTSRTSDVAATVSDAGSGVVSVVAEWTTDLGFSSTPMVRNGDQYLTEFGPFVYLTVPDSTAPDVAITIRATDGAGNESKQTVFAVITSLSFCFG
jgi:RNA polymerase sigma factor (sigma-70 family)